MSDDDHPDDHDSGSEEEHEEAQPAEAVAKGAETAEKVAEMVSEIRSGDASGAVEAGLEATGGAAETVAAALGADEEDARVVAEAVSTAAEVAKSVIGAVGHLTGDRHGEGEHSRGSERAHGESRAHSALGRESDLEEAASHALGRREVRYHLEVDGFEGDFGVRHVELHEALSDLYTCIVDATCRAHPEVSELLGKDAHLSMERGDELRSVHGVIRHATVHEAPSGSHVRLHIVPAMWLLDQSFRSRVWTDKTIPEVVEAIYAERLGTRGRAITNDLTRAYPRHEQLVQYQESDLAFIQRRLEQEGIFTYFRHGGDHEELVLVDTNDGLPLATERDSGQVSWAVEAGTSPTGEDVSQARHVQEVGATDVVVRAYNWTAPEVIAEGTATGRGEDDPSLEIYDHTDAVELYDYDAGQRRYGANDAAEQAGMRAELLDLGRQRWELRTTVVSARPGHVFELVGCPDGVLDSRYLIVGVDASGAATEGESGRYSNRLRVIPVDLPFRPARKTAIPVVHGPETAIVAGPDGEEIHTDEHGRVQVRFHWDREHAPNEPTLTSCWLRVMHSWAGPGFGTTFVPRIGMEVVVSFLGGNPDRPLIVGCVYHGTHASPVVTPDDKTQSAIRTKSSPNSDGFNELRFEDKAGSEFIFTHAQKDYNEVVEHCHTTHVKVDQSNTVDHDHTETVGNDQTLEVKGERMKTVHKPETTYVFDTRTETVHGVETLDLRQTRQTTIGEDEDLTIMRDRKKLVKGTEDQRVEGERTVVITANDNLSVRDGGNRVMHVEGETRVKADGKFIRVQGGTEKHIQDSGKTYIESASEVHVKVGDSHLLLKSDGTITLKTSSTIGMEVGSSKLEMGTSSIALESNEIQLKAGESALKLEASKATLKGAMVNLLADMFATIKGTLVRIN